MPQCLAHSEHQKTPALIQNPMSDPSGPIIANCKPSPGTSLVVQWLSLRAPNAGGPGLIPGQETRSHMLQLRVCIVQLKCATTKKRSHMQQLKDPAYSN